MKPETSRHMGTMGRYRRRSKISAEWDSKGSLCPYAKRSWDHPATNGPRSSLTSKAQQATGIGSTVRHDQNDAGLVTERRSNLMRVADVGPMTTTRRCCCCWARYKPRQEKMVMVMRVAEFRKRQERVVFALLASDSKRYSYLYFFVKKWERRKLQFLFFRIDELHVEKIMFSFVRESEANGNNNNDNSKTRMR